MLDRMKLIGISSAALAIGSIPAHAFAADAQEAPAAVAAADSASGDNSGGEIIVTAQRRAERLQDVPLSVTAASAQDLSRARVTDASRLQILSPGLTWGQQGSDSFPAIRGVRTQLVSAQSDPVIGFYLDGIYQSRTQQQSIPLFDISRVEVQRGPQGTLYGRNTFGGNISVITSDPVDRLEGGINASFGNFAQRQVDGYLNVPVNDDVQLRVAGYHSGHDGYVHSNTTPGLDLLDEDQNAFRASLKAKPASNVEIVLHGGYWERKDNGGGAYGYKVIGTLIDPVTGQRSINGAPVAVNPTVHNGTAFVNGVDIGVPVTGDAWTNQWDYQPFERVHERYVSGQVSWDLGPVMLRSITGYTSFHSNRSADLDQSGVVFPAAGVTGGFSGSGLQAADTKDRSFSQEFQIASSGHGRLEWIVGGYFFQDKIDELYTQIYTAPTATALGTRSDTHINTRAYAGYGQASFALVPDKLKLIGGIRYSTETKDYDITNFTAAPGSWDFATQTPQIGQGSADFDKVTWKAGVEFTPTRRTMVYATVSTGFSSGGINNNSTNPLIPGSYAPQTVTAYEIGTKNRFLNGRLAIDLSGFYNKYRNLQITILDPKTNLSYYASAGAARSYGAEADIKTIPVRNLHVDLTAAWLNARFTQYVRPNPFYSATNGDPVTVDLAGKDVPMSPRIKTTLAVYYDIDLGPAGTITPYVDWLHSSHYYAADYNTALDRQHAYNVVDLSLRWTDASSKYYVEGFANNIGNIPVLYSATVGNSARMQVSYGPPRLYGVRVGAKF